MITETDNNILEKLDPDSPLTGEKLELLGWELAKFQSTEHSKVYLFENYQDPGHKPVLIESWKFDTLSDWIKNGYSFHMSGRVSHCWTVADLITAMNETKQYYATV